MCVHASSVGSLRRHCVAGLGLRRTELVDKVAALYHAWRLEMATAHTLSTFVQCIVAATGDLGTESGFQVAPKASVRTWLPYFDDDGFDEDHGLGAAGEDQHDPVLDTSSSIYIAGLLHIFSNTARDILDAAEQWQVIRPRLNALAIFLNRRTSRQLFVAVCLSRPPHSYLKPLFSSFPYTLKDWRWEYVWRVCKMLLELKYVLTSTWNIRAMSSQPAANLDVPLGHGNVGGEGAGDGDDDLHHETIRQVFGVEVVCVCCSKQAPLPDASTMLLQQIGTPTGLRPRLS